MKLIKARKLTSTFIQIDPVILEENLKFRRCFLGELVKGDDGAWHVRGTLVAERRTETGWQSVEGTSIAKLKAGELAKFELRTEHVKRLITGLNVLADAAEDEGITLRSTQLVVGKKEEIVRIIERDHRAVIEQLINQNRGADFWSTLTSLKADLATQLADAATQSRRRESLATFRTKLETEEWTEPEWESFLIENQWILGYGLRYQFLGLLQRQANYGGTNLTGKGAQKGEFLMATEAEQRFTVLVEIKKPQTPIFHDRADSDPYRSGVPGFSTEFANAISQVQINSRTWENDGSRREDDQELLSRKGIHTISPRSILIFGHTKQLSTTHKTKAFELFRAHLGGTDILTFDELMMRAAFIVNEASHTPSGPSG